MQRPVDDCDFQLLDHGEQQRHAVLGYRMRPAVARVRDHHAIGHAVSAIDGTHHGSWGHLDIAGKSIAFVHGDDPRLLHDLQTANAHDYLFYGHTHVAREHVMGKTRVINPGALHRAVPKTFVILNVETGELESFDVS